MKKAQLFRRSVSVEILKDHSNYKKGSIVEMHPILAARLKGLDVAKTASEKSVSK